eukprot:SAG22_NODE_3821_length_1515_cov_2.201271_1_plen_281_part_00
MAVERSDSNTNMSFKISDGAARPSTVSGTDQSGHRSRRHRRSSHDGSFRERKQPVAVERPDGNTNKSFKISDGAARPSTVSGTDQSGSQKRRGRGHKSRSGGSRGRRNSHDGSFTEPAARSAGRTAATAQPRDSNVSLKASLRNFKARVTTQEHSGNELGPSADWAGSRETARPQTSGGRGGGGGSGGGILRGRKKTIEQAHRPQTSEATTRTWGSDGSRDGKEPDMLRDQSFRTPGTGGDDNILQDQPFKATGWFAEAGGGGDDDGEHGRAQGALIRFD